MSAVRRCRPLPPVRPPGQAVRDATDALAILLAAAGGRPQGVVCLLLDDARRGLACLDIAGPADGAAVLDVGDLLLALAEPALGAVVLASLRPDHRADPSDVACFRELQEALDDGGIDLVDWFLVGDGLATSLAELTGVAPRWSGDGP